MTSQAKRIAGYFALDDQSICYWKDEEGVWWIYLPGAGAGGLPHHAVTEHQDGTISVTPSILLGGHGNKPCHGYLTRGVWTDA